MISLQEKKTSNRRGTAVSDSIASSAKKDFDGAVAIYAHGAEVSDPTDSYVGKLEILSQFVGRPHSRTRKSEVTNQVADGYRVAKASGESFDLAGLTEKLGVPRPRR